MRWFSHGHIFFLNLLNFSSPVGDYLMSISLIHSLYVSLDDTTICFLSSAIFTMYSESGTNVCISLQIRELFLSEAGSLTLH